MKLQRNANEDGQIMVLAVGYILLALLLVTVVAASSSLYIGHKKLLALADGAALAAADTFALGGATAGTAGGVGGAPGALLTSQGVNAAARDYIAGSETPEGLDAIAVGAGTGTVDGRTAQVVVTGVVHPLFINFLVPAGIPITVTGTARANLVQ